MYWNKFYNSNNAVENPSPFATFVTSSEIFQKYDSPQILEVGCGNGRDAYYLGKYGNVIAIDKATSNQDTDNVKFIQKDINDLDASYQSDILYSRFSLHSIDENTEKKLLDFAKQHIDTVFIEARSINDELCGVGEKVSENAYIGKTSYAKPHYRRFIDSEKLCKMLINYGFTIEYVEESTEFAPYKGETPCCLRIIATTPKASLKTK